MNDWTPEEEAARLKARFLGVNQAAFAREHNVPGKASMVSQHIHGLRPINLESAIAYARGFGVPLEEISPRLARQARDATATVQGVAVEAKAGSLRANVIEVNLDHNEQYPAVRRVRFKLSAGASGFGIEYRDEEGAPIVFQRDWFMSRGLKPEALFAVGVSNGSMEPGLHDGDTVVVNTAQNTPKDGVVFAVNYEGELVIKRLVRDGGQWWLCSDNPDQRRFPRKLADEHCLILGEIVHKQSERI